MLMNGGEIMNIKVVGPGCKSCKDLYALTKDVASKLDTGIIVDHVDDVMQMVSYGISKSPALVINEKVISQGKKLKAEEISKIISEYK